MSRMESTPRINAALIVPTLRRVLLQDVLSNEAQSPYSPSDASGYDPSSGLSFTLFLHLSPSLSLPPPSLPPSPSLPLPLSPSLSLPPSLPSLTPTLPLCVRLTDRLPRSPLIRYFVSLGFFR